MKALIDYRDVLRYSRENLPAQLSPELHSARLYGRMFRNADALGLAFFCPHCDQRRGRCRCPQLGRKQEGKWVYHSRAAYVMQWRLSSASLLEAPIDSLPNGEVKREITFFYKYLKTA